MYHEALKLTFSCCGKLHRGTDCRAWVRYRTGTRCGIRGDGGALLPTVRDDFCHTVLAPQYTDCLHLPSLYQVIVKVPESQRRDTVRQLNHKLVS